MKVLYFGGGLGNQIFEYTFYLALKDRFPKERIYGVYPNFKFREHIGGFEIEEIFNVKFPPTSLKAKFFIVLVFFYKKMFPKTRLCSLHSTNVNWDAIVFNAFKSDLSFYENRNDWISFRPINLNAKNQNLINLMLSVRSIVIHVRRGDFLSSKYCDILANIATLGYYQKAIELIKGRFSASHFFVFSDDIEWCKSHLSIPNDTVYVDWNTGKDSYIDLYLMTHAKANIIANSTFSYWGAYLNKNNPIVIYPKKWINANYYPNIFPVDWIGLTSE